MKAFEQKKLHNTISRLVVEQQKAKERKKLLKVSFDAIKKACRDELAEQYKIMRKYLEQKKKFQVRHESLKDVWGKFKLYWILCKLDKSKIQFENFKKKQKADLSGFVKLKT